jgi:hypothetical protein
MKISPAIITKPKINVPMRLGALFNFSAIACDAGVVVAVAMTILSTLVSHSQVWAFRLNSYMRELLRTDERLGGTSGMSD